MSTIVVFALIGLLAFQVRPGRIQSVPRFSRNRRKNPLNAKDLVATYEFTTPNVIVTVDTPMIVAGIPQIMTNLGEVPDGVTWLSPLSFSVHYATPAGTTSVTVPQKDPGIRSATGGWLAPGTFLAP